MLRQIMIKKGKLQKVKANNMHKISTSRRNVPSSKVLVTFGGGFLGGYSGRTFRSVRSTGIERRV